MSQSLHQPAGGPAAQTLSPIPPTEDHSLSSELLEHIHRLRLILPVISTSLMALRHQNAELDADIAYVLSEHACVPLDDEIERIESILASLTWQYHQREAHA
jgi:hypothetical protein